MSVLTRWQRPACHTQLLLSTCLSRGGDGPKITLQRQEIHVAAKLALCPSGKSVQLLARRAEAQAHPTATVLSFTQKSQRFPRGWFAGRTDSLSVPRELPRRSLQGDWHLLSMFLEAEVPVTGWNRGSWS